MGSNEGGVAVKGGDDDLRCGNGVAFGAVLERGQPQAKQVWHTDGFNDNINPEKYFINDHLDEIPKVGGKQEQHKGDVGVDENIASAKRSMEGELIFFDDDETDDGFVVIDRKLLSEF